MRKDKTSYNAYVCSEILSRRDISNGAKCVYGVLYIESYEHGHTAMLIKDIAAIMNCTDRSAHRMIHELADAGLISIKNTGRESIYTITAFKKLV